MGNVTIAHTGHLFKGQHSKKIMYDITPYKSKSFWNCLAFRKKKGWGFIPSFSCTSPPLKNLSHYVTKTVFLVQF